MCCRTRPTPALDLAGAALTFFSVQVSDKPADEDHTYGHGKIENLSSFGEAGLMAVSCAWIICEAVSRIAHHIVELRHSIWPVLVVRRFDRRGLLALAATARGGRAHRFARAGHRRLPLRLRHLVHAGRACRAGRQLDGFTIRHFLAALCRSAGRHRGFAHDSAPHSHAWRAKRWAC